MRPPAFIRGPEHEAEVPGLRRTAEPRDIHQGRQPRPIAATQRQQTLGDEGAVEALQRHHVGHRAERDQIEEAEEIGLVPLCRPEPARAQLAVERNHRHEHEADSREVAETGQIVEPVRIDHRERGGKALVGLVMVDHDDVETEAARFEQRLVAGGPAIDRDQQRRALPGQRSDRLRVRAIALEQTIGNMNERAQTAVAEKAPEQPRGRGAVDVIVAEDRDGLAARDRIRQPRRGGGQVGEPIGIGHQRAHRRIEKAHDLVHLDPASCDDARQQLRHMLVPLSDCERACLPALVEPVAPRAATERALDAEEASSGRGCRCGRRNGHGTPGANRIKKACDTG